jgi:hypothetical protein
VHSGEERAPRVRGAGFLAAALAAGLLLLTSCVVLPVRMAPAVDGLVVDQASGKPVSDALVVVRFDGRYDDVLPDRDLIGHQEARSDASGRFRMERLVRAGLSAWPHFKTEARVVGVMRAGYRCAAPQAVPSKGAVRIALTPALDELDRRESCRPVTGERGEVTAYMDAWRALFADAVAQAPSESDRQVERLLGARTVLGFGENCAGPVTDLALAPDGRRAALRIAGAGGDRWERVELGSGARSAIESPEAVSPNARLAWASASELILVEVDAAPERALTSSRLATARTRAIWSAQDTPLAAPDAGSRARRAPLQPGDLSDESDRLWNGRSFALGRTLDPSSGLPADELRVVREDGSRYALRLPGEACGQAGHFGRPHYRMTADARSGLDLRFLEGGCHAVRIDLETGDWQKLDRASEPATCESARRVPASNLFVALRGYMREVEATLVAGGADPAAAFVLEIGEDGETTAQARDFAGERRTLRVPRFPLRTPLRRIDVSTVGLARPAAPAPANASSDAEPL